MIFQDQYFNSFSRRERVLIINTLRIKLSEMTPDRYLKTYTASSMFPYGPITMLVRDYALKLTNLKELDDNKRT